MYFKKGSINSNMIINFTDAERHDTVLHNCCAEVTFHGMMYEYMATSPKSIQFYTASANRLRNIYILPTSPQPENTILVQISLQECLVFVIITTVNQQGYAILIQLQSHERLRHVTTDIIVTLNFSGH